MGRISDALGVLTGSKALGALDPAPLLYSMPGVPGRRITNTAARRHNEAYGGREPIDHVMECVNLYARTASHAEYHFCNRAGRKLVANPRAAEYKGADVSAAPADLIELFRNPGRGVQDYTELIELSIIDLLLVGEFFWLKNGLNAFGQPNELYRLNPKHVDIIPGKVAAAGYLYQPGGIEEQRFAPEEIVHVKLPNPHDPWRGLGVIAGNPRMYDIALALDDSIAQYYEQGTRLTGVLESERSVPPNTWDKIKREFQNLYSGRANAYKVAALERGLTFKPLSGNADQAGFAEAQDKVRDRIAAAFGIPTPLLGDVGGSTDRQAVREAQRIWDNKIMRPFLDSFQHRISAKLLTGGDWEGIDYIIEYQYVMPIEDKLDLASNMALLPVTVKELRAQIDLDPLGDERDDKLMVEPGLSPADAAGRRPRQQPGGAAPYPAGAGGRGGQPTTADAQKALQEQIDAMTDKLAVV